MGEYSVYTHLQETMHDFYRLTHIRMSFFDPVSLVCVLHSGIPHSEFCNALRSNKTLDERCAACDRRAMNAAKYRADQLLRFRCHAGLDEYVYPVYYNNSLLGYFMYGQTRPPQINIQSERQRQTMYKEFGMDPARMRAMYDKLPVADESRMLSAGRIMTTIVRYAYLRNLTGDFNAPLMLRLKIYIQLNYMNPVSIDTACAFFNVSRSHLCHTIRKEFGSTFTAMLSQQRVESVCRSLHNGLSVPEAAVRAGFGSANYMIRIFKKITGVTPKQYMAGKGPGARENEGENDK